MNIETKYSIGDTTYVIKDGEIEKCTVTRIGLDIYKSTSTVVMVTSYQVRYVTKQNCPRDATISNLDRFFDSKAEAGAEWLKQQGLDCGVN